MIKDTFINVEQLYVIDNNETKSQQKCQQQWSETGKECGSQKNYGTLSAAKLMS